MLSVQQAEATVLEAVQPLDAWKDSEHVNLLAAPGRVLATMVTSELDFPHWDNSAMDGYAVRFADVQVCCAEQPVVLEVVEEVPAGYRPQKTIQPGQAARILTGSVMPAGADTVVIQEETERMGDQVTILAAPEPYAFVRYRASFYQAGTPLLAAGVMIQAPEIAVLAAAQCSQVKVYRRPKVAILSTGDELVTPGQPLQWGQIVDSNQYALATLVVQAGAEPVLLGIVPDCPQQIRAAIAQAITQADVVLSSGGVSVGDYDYIDRILSELGATIHFRAVAIKPGKPLTFATFTPNAGLSDSGSEPHTPHRPILYFGLPGNPVSSLVSVWRFVQPALKKLSGLVQGWKPEFVQATVQHELQSGGKRETYLWGQLKLGARDYEFHLAGGSHSSGNLINLVETNGLAVIPVGQRSILPGEQVRVLRMSAL